MASMEKHAPKAVSCKIDFPMINIFNNAELNTVHVNNSQEDVWYLYFWDI